MGSAGFNYSRMQASVNRLLSRFGKRQIQVILHEPGPLSGPGYDPTVTAPIQHPATAVLLDYNAKDVDGTRIMQGDRRLYVVPNAAYQPDTSWLVQIGARYYRIENINILEPGDTQLLWDIQCRTT